MGRVASESFDKYEGLGNDFIVVAASAEEIVSSEWVRSVCDRRRGIGGDGVLAILPAREGGDARMRVINSDGSVPEMCGNGLRCAALHVARARGIETGELTIETDAGNLRCAIERRGDEAIVLADMGVARVLDDVVIDGVELTRVDVGNPHAVSFRAVARAQFERLGPLLSTASFFERGTNVEFVKVDPGPRPTLDVLVWERGAGATLACGTGACAAVAAARSKGLVALDGPVLVRLPGGHLEIAVDGATGRTTLRGPARRVFGGRLTGGAS